MATKKVSTYRDLDVWKKSMNLTKSIYTETRTFPKEELFGLTSQARRAAVSIPSNIAEGNAKGSRKDYRRHLLISRGSVGGARDATLSRLIARLSSIGSPSISSI